MLRSKLIGFYITQAIVLAIIVLSYFFILQSFFLFFAIAYNFILWLIESSESYNLKIDNVTGNLIITNRLKMTSRNIGLKTINFLSFKHYNSFRHPIQEATISINNCPPVILKLSGIKDSEVYSFLDILSNFEIKNEFVEK